MVWFQCEDCGENLKKPKLANHFRMCSAYKLSCIDCGQTFSQESVQSHTQCISEAEKYGPKDQGKASHNAQTKPSKPKPNSEVDVNVGLSTRPPWFCSLCNTSATSQQTLLLHADGKKHRAKARAFHAAQKPTTQEVPNSNGNGTADDSLKEQLVEFNGSKKMDEPVERVLPDNASLETVEKVKAKKSKRKHDASSELTTKSETNLCNTNVEIMETEQIEELQHQPKKNKCSEGEEHMDKQDKSKEASLHKIKWKKLVTSTLKSVPDGVMKTKKLQKLVITSVRESGVSVDKSQLQKLIMDKINLSSRFVVDNKCIRLASKNDSS